MVITLAAMANVQTAIASVKSSPLRVVNIGVTSSWTLSAAPWNIGTSFGTTGTEPGGVVDPRSSHATHAPRPSAGTSDRRRTTRARRSPHAIAETPAQSRKRTNA